MLIYIYLFVYLYILSSRKGARLAWYQPHNTGYFVRESQALVAPNPPQGVSVRGQAGLVINKLSLLGEYVMLVL